MNKNELVKIAMALEVHKKPYEITPIFDISDIEKEKIDEYEVYDENGIKLFSVPTEGGKPMSKYQLENEISKKLKESKKEIEAANAKYGEGDIILYDNSTWLILTVGDDYYNMGDLLREPYNDTDIVIENVDAESKKTSVETAKKEMEEKGEDPSMLDKGLAAFEIYKGKIWEKSELETEADSSERIKETFSNSLSEGWDYWKTKTPYPGEPFSDKEECFAALLYFRSLDPANQTVLDIAEELKVDMDKCLQVLNRIEEEMQDITSSLETKSSEYTDFVKKWFADHPEAKPGDEVTMKQLKEDWEASKKTSAKLLYQIYKFNDRPTLLVATDILKTWGIDFISDETNNSVEIELIDKDDAEDITAKFDEGALHFEVGPIFEDREISYIREESLEPKVAKEKIERKASKDVIEYKNKLSAIASQNIANFTYIYRFATKEDMYKACKVLHKNMLLYTINEENDSIGVFDNPVGSLFTEAKLDFTETNDLGRTASLNRKAKMMMDSEFDKSKGCWELAEMPDGTLSFIKKKPLAQRINDVLDKEEKEVSAGIKVLARQIVCDLGDRTTEIKILGYDPDNKGKVIVEDIESGQKLSVLATSIFPID